MSYIKFTPQSAPLGAYSKPAKPFSGFVCIGFAGGEWFAGCDTDSASDARDNMVRSFRQTLHQRVTVEDAYLLFQPHTLLAFRVEQTETPSVELLKVGEEASS